MELGFEAHARLNRCGRESELQFRAIVARAGLKMVPQEGLVDGLWFRVQDQGCFVFYPHGASTIEVKVEETQVESQGTQRNGL